MNLKRLFIIFISAVLISGLFAGPASAGKLDQLMAETEGLGDYLNQLTRTITALTLKQEHIQAQIDDVGVRIEEIEGLLEEAEQACAEQYEAMKLRIVYLYESGNTNYLEAIFSSESIADILNRFEYIDNMVGYDRDMLVKYQEIVETIESLKTGLLEEKAALEELKQEAIDNLNEATTVSYSANSELIDMGIDVDEIDSLVTDYIAENGDSIREEFIQDIENKTEENPDYDWFDDESNWELPTVPEEIQTQAPVEQATDVEWEEPDTDPVYEETTSAEVIEVETTTDYIEPETTTEYIEPETTTEYYEEPEDEGGYVDDYGYSDAYMIACLVSGEVGFVGYDAQWAVADLILNRVESGYWSSSVYGVLHDPGQFDAVYWYYIPGTSMPSYLYFIENGPLDVSLAATYDAMGNRGASHGYQFYCTMWFYEGYPEIFENTYGQEIGGQWFYNYIW